MGDFIDDFSKNFWNRAGRNTADRVSNAVFGDNWARPHKIISDEARADAIRQRAEAEAYEIESRADLAEKIANKNQINAIDAAVLQNIDKVIAMPFSNDANELAHQLSGLAIQLATNSFSKSSEEDKVRAKYTEAVFEKYKQGLNILIAKDPDNSNIDYLMDAFYKAEKKKNQKIRRIKIFLLIFMLIIWAFFFLAGLDGASRGRGFGLLVVTSIIAFSVITILIYRVKRKKEFRKIL